MKIAFLSKEYPPYGLNFASALYYPWIANALAKLGHEVHIISQAVHGRVEQIENGIHLHRVGPPPRTGSGITRMRYNLSAWFALKELINKYDIELVDAPVTFGEGFLASLWKRSPLVLQTFAFSDMFMEAKSYSGLGALASLKLSAYMENVSIKRADMIIANSQQTQRYLIEDRRVPAERIRLVSEARIDLEKCKYTPSDIRDKLGIPPKSPIVLDVGLLQARKGFHILCDAIPPVVKQFPDTMFIFLGRDTDYAPGGGSFKQYLLNNAERLGVLPNVKIIDDFVPEAELVQFYSACDVFAVSSLYETFGWPAIEAMACGRPLVATATGVVTRFDEMSEMLAIVPPEQPKALAQAIIRLLSTPRSERERLAASHRHIVEEHFSAQQMVDSTLAVYEETIAERRRKK